MNTFYWNESNMYEESLFARRLTLHECHFCTKVKIQKLKNVIKNTAKKKLKEKVKVTERW